MGRDVIETADGEILIGDTGSGFGCTVSIEVRGKTRSDYWDWRASFHPLPAASLVAQLVGSIRVVILAHEAPQRLLLMLENKGPGGFSVEQFGDLPLLIIANTELERAADVWPAVVLTVEQGLQLAEDIASRIASVLI